ncbi:hypothetical protein M427DRAFT_76916, partial [Gonapodya prolifera JEL478]
IEWRNQGPHQCYVLVATVQKGKTNQTSRLETGGKDGVNPFSHVQHSTQLKAVNKMLAAVGINSISKTHARRHGPVRQLEQMAGIDDNQVRQLGRWNGERMEGSSMSNMPRAPILGLAGFSTVGKNCFFSRNVVIPSSELQSAIFPKID